MSSISLHKYCFHIDYRVLDVTGRMYHKKFFSDPGYGIPYSMLPTEKYFYDLPHGNK